MNAFTLGNSSSYKGHENESSLNSLIENTDEHFKQMVCFSDSQIQQSHMQSLLWSRRVCTDIWNWGRLSGGRVKARSRSLQADR